MCVSVADSRIPDYTVDKGCEAEVNTDRVAACNEHLGRHHRFKPRVDRVDPADSNKVRRRLRQRDQLGSFNNTHMCCRIACNVMESHF